MKCAPCVLMIICRLVEAMLHDVTCLGQRRLLATISSISIKVKVGFLEASRVNTSEIPTIVSENLIFF